ncbi:MAG: AAA family ATPase, partial [Candidatus Altiarchaeales archaeon]|nr:AAA family ATPase [Candidatus Altiarchaeales archaeon]
MLTEANRSASGIPQLDGLLGGGFPRGSVILLSGASGTGKTTLSFEWLFNGVTMFNENGVYVTFTEPLFKTLKNLEELTYYDRDIIEDERIKILDIRKSLEVAKLDENIILNLIEEEVKRNDARRLIIDSITAVAYNLEDKTRIRRFIFDLGTMLASLGCTTILTSEVVGEGYSVYGVEEFISDGIIKLEQKDVRFQPTRTLKIMKMRGIRYSSGENTFRITSAGMKLFPQLSVPLAYASEMEKVSTGVKGFDEMTKGGIYRGSSNLVAGASGTGKSITGLHFIAEGLRQNEP